MFRNVQRCQHWSCGENTNVRSPQGQKNQTFLHNHKTRQEENGCHACLDLKVLISFTHSGFRLAGWGGAYPAYLLARYQSTHRETLLGF